MLLRLAARNAAAVVCVVGVGVAIKHQQPTRVTKRTCESECTAHTCSGHRPPRATASATHYLVTGMGPWSTREEIACVDASLLPNYQSELNIVWVNKKYQNRGYGRLVVSEMEDALRHFGARHLCVSSVSPATNFYTKCGFVASLDQYLKFEKEL